MNRRNLMMILPSASVFIMLSTLALTSSSVASGTTHGVGSPRPMQDDVSIKVGAKVIPPILSVDFEDGVLDSSISISTVGSFGSRPGIKDITNFGSLKAFGFGRSTCNSSCFDNFVTFFAIRLPESTYVSTLSFKEMELFDNWGSDGAIYVDGTPLGTGYRDFGRLPYNDLQADGFYRSREFPINRTISTITLRVGDITNRSEIFIDDLVLWGDQSNALFNVAPTKLAFANVLVGTSRTDSVTVSNTGTATLHIMSVFSDEVHFTVAPSLDSIGPSAQKRFWVSFAPDSFGPRSGHIIFAHNGPSSPDSVFVNGTGIAPVLTVQPGILDFGSVPVGISRTDTVMASNAGTAPLHLFSVLSNNQRFVVTPTKASLEPSATQKFAVTFSPLWTTGDTAKLVFVHDAASSPDTVELRGTGVYDLQAPWLYAVRDVPHDQGGHVALAWVGSSIDTNVSTLTHYSIWRAIPEGGAKARRLVSPRDITPGFQGQAYRRTLVNGSSFLWEWIANQPAHRFSAYSYTASTLYDSTSASSGKHYFLISAHTVDPNVFYDSNVDSGHSVDNLAPLAPRGLAGVFASGKVTLHWSSNAETDLTGYVIYRGSSPDDVRDIATTADTIFVDHAPLQGQRFYRLRAVDIHGNLSPLSDETITGVSGEGSPPPGAFELSQNYPNPFNPETRIRFSLPREQFVTIRVVDLLGTEVAVVLSERRGAGLHEIVFDARNVASGIYFYTLRAGTFVQTKTLAIVR